MGKFRKPKCRLGKFLKGKISSHNRKGLMKLGFGIISGALIFNVMFAGTAAPIDTPYTNTPAVDQITDVKKDNVPGFSHCWRLIPVHTNSAHDNVLHNNGYQSLNAGEIS